VWYGTVEGRWTRRPIKKKVKFWVSVKHGTVANHLAQMLTGRGCFGQYLHKFAELAERGSIVGTKWRTTPNKRCSAGGLGELELKVGSEFEPDM